MKVPTLSSNHSISSKKATVISYIIPLMIAIAAIIVFSVWFLSSSTLFQKRGASATCQAEAATYCLGGSRWDPACGPAPDCAGRAGGGGGGDGGTTKLNCNSKCKNQEFASGECREKIDGEGLTLNRYTATHSFRDYTPEEIAESFDMSQSWPPSANKLQQVHQLRPDYIALFYRNVKVIKNYRDEEMETALANNWLLKDENGDYAKDINNHILVDVGNTGYQKWVANIIKENIENYGFDGVFADNSLSARATEHFWGATAMPINPRTGKLYTDEEVREALIGLHNEIKNVIGSKKLVCNGIFEGHRFWRRFDGYNEFLTDSPLDGFMSEGLWYQFQGNWMSEETWKESLDFLIYVQDNFLKNNPNRVYVPMTKVQDIGGEPYPLPPGSTKEQIIKYAFASTMLGIKNNQIYYSTIADKYLIDDVALPLHDIDFGSPLGDYDLIDGTSVYYRDFSKVKVLVNPGASSYTVGLGGDYKTLDGNTVSSITIQPHTGEILLNSGLNELNVKKYVAYNWRLFWQGNEYRDYSGCWDMMQMHYEPAVSDNIPNRIKQEDPNIEILLYRNTRAVYGRETEELELFRQNNWILKTNNGEEIVSKDYPSNFMVDKGNPDYQEWFANWMKGYVDTYAYDGAFLDNSLFGSSENMWSTMGVNSHCDAQTECLPINPRTGNYWTNDDWIEADVGLINKVKEKLGDKVVVLNGPNNGRKFFESSRHDNYVAVMQRSNMDGFIIELWTNDGSGNFYTEDDWRKSVDMICWIEENLPKADIVIPVGTGWRDIPKSVSNDDFAIYSFASLLLGASSNRYYMLQTPGEGELENYCRPTVQALYDVDIGVPLGDYRIIEDTHIYERDFSKGKVLVNPTYQSYTVNFIRSFKTLDGNIVSSITMQPHSGEILLNNGLDELNLKSYISTTYFREMNAETIAQLYDMCQAFWWDETKVREVKQIRPDFETLFYRNMRSVSDVAVYDKDMWPLAVDNNWLLRDIDGNYVTDNIWGLYAIDIGNSDYQNEVANLIKEKIDEYGYDGVFCDNSLRISAEVEWGSLSSKPINPRTGTYWTDAEVFQANLQLYKAIRNAIGSKLIVGNGIARGYVFYNEMDEYIAFLSDAKIDGVTSELMWYQYQGEWMSEEDWLKSLDMLVWFQDNFLKEDPQRIFIATTKLQRADKMEYPLPSGCTKEQMVTYAFASTLLGIKTNQNYLLLLIDPDFTIEFIHPLFNIAIGAPQSEYYMVEGTHIYARDFTKVRVLVNPSKSSYTVDLGGDYNTLDGNTVSSITMQPHSGEILLNIVATTTEGCQPAETSIGQDGCNLGYICCCSPLTPSTVTDETVIVNYLNEAKTNKLSLGAQISFTYTSEFPEESAYHNLVEEAKMKMFRMMDSYIGYNYGPDGQRTNNGIYHPCRQWDDSSKTGTWDWQYADRLVESISNLDAETMIALGYRYSSGFQLPSGMQIDPSTGWPYPDSFGEYCRQWAIHFKGDVKYYEIMNEAWFYFNEGGIFREDRAESFLELFDACYDAIKEEDPSALVGTDSSLQVKKFLDYWIDNDGKLDFLSFHKYDCHDILMEDEIPLQSAEQKYFETYSYWYGVDDARQKWADSHGGVILPAIISESNWGATSIDGTDPRIQKVVGAVRTALVLRKSILEGVDYHVYFDLTSSKSWEQSNKPSGGVGFGMINSDDKKPWYPYYVYKMVGSNLVVGDSIVDSTSTSEDIRSLAWINNGKLNILLVHKSNKETTVSLQGVNGQLNYFKIEDPDGTSYLNAEVQTGTINADDAITLDGYTVMLLQKAIEPISPMRAIQWFRTSPFTSTSGFQSIEELREAIPSCNYVYMDVFIDSIDEVATPRTTYESELGPAVQKAKQEGFRVVWRVQPKVGVELGNRLNFDPPDPDSFFSNYADAVVYWARKAEEYGVDDFVIGTELSKIEKYNDHWRSLIQNVKDVFTGKISYNTNFWYEDADFDAKKSAFWMQDLDYIGVSAYWRMCSDEEAQRGVTVEELVNNWHSYVGWTLQGEDIVKEHLEVFSETHRKPIVIVTGLQSAEDACLTPWAWDRTTIDLNEQDNWYEAVFRVFSDEGWIYGFMFDGAWQTYANKRQNPDNAEFTVQGKPAEQTIEKWFESI